MIKFNEPMSKHCSLRTGGQTSQFFVPEDEAALSNFLKNNKTQLLFVGLGKTFQIWEPKIFEKFKVVARKKAYQNRSNLKWENKQKEEIK